MAETLSPGLAQARHAVAAARQAQAVGRPGLGWAALQAWPGWALADAATATDDATLAHWRLLGLRWYAAALRRCIDGALWAEAEALVPGAALQAVLDAAAADATGAGAPSLPAPEALADETVQHGRGIALAALGDAALSAAVAAASGTAPSTLDTATAQAWVAWALALRRGGAA